jgi:hypothetical protein
MQRGLRRQHWRIASHKSGGLTALPHGNIGRLHAAARKTTIALENSPGLPNQAVTALPQPSRKK